MWTPKSALKSRKYVLNPEAVFLLEQGRERAFLPPGDYVQRCRREGGRRVKKQGQEEGLESQAAWPLSARKGCVRAFLVPSLPRAHGRSHPQGTRRSSSSSRKDASPFPVPSERPPDSSGIG